MGDGPLASALLSQLHPEEPFIFLHQSSTLTSGTTEPSSSLMTSALTRMRVPAGSVAMVSTLPVSCSWFNTSACDCENPGVVVRPLFAVEFRLAMRWDLLRCWVPLLDEGEDDSAAWKSDSIPRRAVCVSRVWRCSGTKVRAGVGLSVRSMTSGWPTRSAEEDSVPQGKSSSICD